MIEKAVALFTVACLVVGQWLQRRPPRRDPSQPEASYGSVTETATSAYSRRDSGAS